MFLKRIKVKFLILKDSIDLLFDAALTIFTMVSSSADYFENVVFTVACVWVDFSVL